MVEFVACFASGIAFCSRSSRNIWFEAFLVIDALMVVLSLSQHHAPLLGAEVFLSMFLFFTAGGNVLIYLHVAEGIHCIVGTNMQHICSSSAAESFLLIIFPVIDVIVFIVSRMLCIVASQFCVIAIAAWNPLWRLWKMFWIVRLLSLYVRQIFLKLVSLGVVGLHY